MLSQMQITYKVPEPTEKNVAYFQDLKEWCEFFSGKNITQICRKHQIDRRTFEKAISGERTNPFTIQRMNLIMQKERLAQKKLDSTINELLSNSKA